MASAYEQPEARPKIGCWPIKGEPASAQEVHDFHEALPKFVANPSSTVADGALNALLSHRQQLFTGIRDFVRGGELQTSQHVKAFAYVVTNEPDPAKQQQQLAETFKVLQARLALRRDTGESRRNLVLLASTCEIMAQLMENRFGTPASDVKRRSAQQRALAIAAKKSTQYAPETFERAQSDKSKGIAPQLRRLRGPRDAQTSSGSNESASSATSKATYDAPKTRLKRE